MTSASNTIKPFILLSSSTAPPKMSTTSPKIPRSEYPSLSSSIIESNDDLLIEILFLLPVKSICRFKAVSKRWYSVISDPQFCLRRSIPFCKNLTHLYVFRQKPKCSKSRYDIIPLYDFGKDSGAGFSKLLKYSDDDSPMGVVQSCNGLFLCRTGGIETIFCKYNYYVCNPTTRQFRLLPDPIGRDFVIVGKVDAVLGVNLAFDPRKSPHFKVVCAYFSSRDGGGKQCELEVYSSETDQWRRVDDPISGKLKFLSGVYWNGGMNWLSSSATAAGMYFNLEEERLGKLPMLPVPTGTPKRSTMYFGECYDHLLLVEFYDFRARQFDVYEMDSQYSGWSVRYRIDIEQVMKAYFKPSESSWNGYKIISIVSGGSDQKSYVILNIKGKGIRYDIGDGSFTKIWDFGKTADSESRVPPFFKWYDTFQYIESICAV